MDKDNIKKFISENEEEFDFGMPSNKVWEGIEKEMKPKKSNGWLISGVAASICFVLVTGFLLLKDTTNTEEPILVETKIEAEDLIKNEVSEIETFYVTQVNLKIEEVKKYEESEELLEEIDLLKEEFALLQQDMGEGANSEEILEAMIQNYRLRLSLLEDLLQEFEEENNEENEKEYL